MTIRLFINTHNFFLSEDEMSFSINTISIWQGHTLRKEVFLSDDFVRIAGTRVLNNLINDYAFGCAVIDIEDYKDSGQEEIAKLLQSQSYIRYKDLESFLQFLWFIKDNSICADIGYGFIPGINLFLETSSSLSNSTASGTFIDTTFTTEELDRALEICKKYTSLKESVITADQAPYISLDHSQPKVTRTSNHFPIKHYNENNRINRAIIFLANARNSLEIPQKIALYIPIFECLFSVENDEIKHKVAERVANYIGGTKEKKKEYYDIISDAYNIRSKFMHGAEIKKNGKSIANEKMIEISTKIDSILRIILTKVIMDDSIQFMETNEEKMRNYYTSLIFQSDTN